MTLSVAVIGSFKQHYEPVLKALTTFREAGWTVTSPAGAAVVEPGIPFVRFVSDEPNDSDALVQTRTLINIFAADLTYVVAPGGYVGRTTCYEIGRLVQARRPIYFSEHVIDLPVELPSDILVSPGELVELMDGSRQPRWLFATDRSDLAKFERQLVDER